MGWKFILAIIVLSVYFFGIAVVLFKYITPQTAERFSAIGTILAAAAVFPTLLFVVYQSSQMKQAVHIQDAQSKMQHEAFRIEHRPYLFLEDDNLVLGRNDPEGGWFGGADLRFRNVGKNPATITEAKYLFASDVRGEVDVVGWFNKEYGGFPDIKVLFPEQKDFFVPMHPNIAPSDNKPRLIYIGAVISYEGPERDMKYWYKFSKLYALELEHVVAREGQLKGVEVVRPIMHPLKPDHDWDRNLNTDPPALQEPKWKEYLEQKHIKRITR